MDATTVIEFISGVVLGWCIFNIVKLEIEKYRGWEAQNAR